MSAKTERFYLHPTSALLRSGKRTLLLKNNDRFTLVELEGRVAVAREGVLYFVRPDKVQELKRRSLVAKVAKTQSDQVHAFNTLCLDVLKVLHTQVGRTLMPAVHGRNLKKYSSASVVGVSFQAEKDLTVVVGFSEKSALIRVLATSRKTLDWEGTKNCEAFFNKYLSFLKNKKGLHLGRTTRSISSFSNVMVLDKAFSGFAWSAAANWNP